MSSAPDGGSLTPTAPDTTQIWAAITAHSTNDQTRAAARRPGSRTTASPVANCLASPRIASPGRAGSHDVTAPTLCSNQSGRAAAPSMTRMPAAAA